MSILGTKGQVVIQKALRDALGLEPGFVSTQRLVDDHIEIRFFPPEHNNSLRGILAASISESLPPEAWQEVRAQAWADAVSETSENESE